MNTKILGHYAIQDGLLVNSTNGLALKLGKRAKPTSSKPPYYLTTLEGGYISSLYPDTSQEPQNGQKRYFLDFEGEALLGIVDLNCQTFAIQPRPPKSSPKSKASNIVMDFVSKFDTNYDFLNISSPEPLPPQGKWQRPKRSRSQAPIEELPRFR
jgi:hypothetical protein